MTSAGSCGGRPLRALVALASLALVADGRQAAGRLGLLARRRASASSKQAPAESLLSPQPNDTITVDYWMRVDSALQAAGQSTSRQPTLNDPPAAPTPLPWDQVMHASKKVEVVDTPAMASDLDNWEKGTPLPPAAMAAQEMMQKKNVVPVDRSMPVVPYDMFIGAGIMNDLSVQNTEMPPPSQEIVNEQFVAQCPMVMFSDQLHVRAPKCGHSLGEWVEPNTERTIMRWQGAHGGLRFDVDSKVHGNGSVPFASFKESFSINSWFFKLRNCLQVERFTVEEQVIKVSHMSSQGHSTVRDHSQRGNHEAIFYKYIIRHTNGTAAAETEMFRMGQDLVNISLPVKGNESRGKLIAVATRTGHWKQSGWRECTGNPRGWALHFPASSHEMETVATVQDLRVASAATITLMAYRDEATGVDGFQHVGEGDIYYDLVKTAFLFFLALLLLSLALIFITRRGIDKKLKKFLFRVEGALLPKRATILRENILLQHIGPSH